MKKMDDLMERARAVAKENNIDLLAAIELIRLKEIDSIKYVLYDLAAKVDDLSEDVQKLQQVTKNS